ncbi:hypothetical protein FA95DRAFT_87471 [Auriscalpium vulgare]|uniref:Uncharacterized protein n=1 Tax=Auriscalpium vulgare TaxID=40419 RepID=A0ACB8RNK7_9AGAM|nr:hypothetical protein FA95DRAFT_87471 [Auriscalpium vulgare]
MVECDSASSSCMRSGLATDLPLCSLNSSGVAPLAARVSGYSTSSMAGPSTLTQRPPPTHFRSAQGSTGISRIDYMLARAPSPRTPSLAYSQRLTSIRCAPLFAESSALVGSGSVHHIQPDTAILLLCTPQTDANAVDFERSLSDKTRRQELSFDTSLPRAVCGSNCCRLCRAGRALSCSDRPSHMFDRRIYAAARRHRRCSAEESNQDKDARDRHQQLHRHPPVGKLCLRSSPQGPRHLFLP